MKQYRKKTLMPKNLSMEFILMQYTGKGSVIGYDTKKVKLFYNRKTYTLISN
jgi:hypothetical protein